MSKPRFAIAAAACAALALLPSAASTQERNAETRQHLTVWADSFSAAFSPGWWEGEMQAFDSNGKMVDSTKSPSCIKSGESNRLATEMHDAMNSIADVGDCTSRSGGAGSLDLEMRCTMGDRQVTFLSKGQYSDGAVDWTVDFKFTGPDAPTAQSMKVTARRTRTSC
ncbi:MAG: hypothetical protein ACKOPM_05705 [Novosphingobium sp.]